MKRRWAWSSFFLLAIVCAALPADPAWAVPGGGGSVPGFSKLEEKATEAENQVARFGYTICSILFIVGLLQSARGNGVGIAMVVGSLAAAALIACREDIMQWILT